MAAASDRAKPNEPASTRIELLVASEICQYGSGSTGRDDIALALVEAEGFLGRFAGCMRTPGKPQHFG